MPGYLSGDANPALNPATMSNQNMDPPVTGKPQRWLLLIMLPLLWACNARSDDGRMLDITHGFEYANTAPGQVDPVKLLKGEIRPDFRPLHSPQSFRERGKETWLRAALPPDADPRVLEIPVLLLQHAQVWYALADGSVVSYRSGTAMPFRERPVRYQGVAFPVPDTEGEPLPLLIRLQTGNPLNFAAILWDRDAWQEYSYNLHAWYGLLIGSLLVLALYNLFLAFTLRDSSYFHYVGYMLGMVATIMTYSGLSEEYFWPDQGQRHYIVLASGVGTFFGVAFVNRFLGVRTRHPWLFRLSTLNALFGALLGIGTVWGIYLVPRSVMGTTLHLTLLVSAIYYVGMSLYSYWRGMKQARFLALGMSVLVAAMVIHFLYLRSMIGYSIPVFHALEAGILMEAVLMSLALSDRIKVLAEEKRRLDEQYVQMQRNFTLEMIDLEEAEKKKYASFLHDSVGHGLLVLKQQLDVFMSGAEDELARRRLEDMKKQCSGVMDEVRSLSHELHPHMLKNLGLKDALLSVLERAFSSTETAWFADIDDALPALPADMEMAVYRITQEAVSNILKYAHALEVYYSLKIDEGRLRMVLKDDGVGFDPEVEARGLGLKMMKGHALLLEGTLALRSRPGLGTSLALHLPLP